MPRFGGNPPKWVNVYPQGTKEGDEEQLLFICLARNPKYEWRSVATIAKETGLSKERVEEILSKYYKRGMVFQSSKNDDLWAYWERVPNLVNGNTDSISDKDKKDRIEEAMDDKN
jgi:hypothetical protein